jgi:hypothetical protein
MFHIESTARRRFTIHMGIRPYRDLPMSGDIEMSTTAPSIGTA